jgi:hypothetical protein
LKEICGLDAELPREPIDNIDTSSIQRTLERTDVGSIDFSTMRQLLLRQLGGLAMSPQIGGKHLSYVHNDERDVLQSISPRSILYKSKSDTFASLLDRLRTASNGLLPGDDTHRYRAVFR